MMTTWLKGLLSAILSGAASAAGAMVLDPDHFGVDHLRHLGLVAGVGAIVGLINYLKQSPLPANGESVLDKAAKAVPVVLLAAALGATVAGCHPPATIQSPHAKHAYNADQVVQQLGNFQNFVIDAQKGGRVKLQDARDLVTWLSGDPTATPPVVGLMDTIAADPTNYLAIAAQSWSRWRWRVLNLPALAQWVPVLDGLLLQ